MDRAPFQVADVHELLHSTLMMFGDRGKDAGKDNRSRWSRNSTSRCPKFTAIQAISTRCGPTSSTTRSRRWAEGGTLTVRTCAKAMSMVRVEICDDGPGIPEDIVRPHLHAVLHHQAVRRGHRPRAGSGLAHRRGEAPRRPAGRVRARRHAVHRPAAAGGGRTVDAARSRTRGIAPPHRRLEPP